MKDSRPDIDRLLSFNKLLLRFRAIERTVLIPPECKEHENDVEHSYNLAMTAWYLAQHFQNINNEKVIQLALVHDWVEIYAGDTFVYGDTDSLQSQAEREAKAIKTIEINWPDAPEIIQSIKFFEDRQTPEAKFVYALDKLMPALLVYMGDGESWRKKNITFEMFIKEKNPKISLSEEVNEYYQQLLKLLSNNSDFFPENKDNES